MKTIIEDGKNKFKVRCACCNCLFKYDIKDIKFIELTVRDFWFVVCPKCTARVEHKVYNSIEEDSISIIEDKESYYGK